MPKYLAAIDLQKNELKNARVQNLATAPSSPVVGQIYFDTVDGTTSFWTGSAWQSTGGAAGGDLTGSYPNPQIATGVIVNADINSSAAIALSKLAVDPLARANHTGTQLAATISDFNTAVRLNRLDQLAAPTGAVSLNSQKITSLADPTSAQDAATKAYVDAARQGLDVKDSVRASSTGDLTLSGTQTVDGVALIAGNRILVKDQTDNTENGIYVVGSGSWNRALDADSSSDVTAGMYTFVEEGAVNGDSGFVLTTDNPITLGTTGLDFTQFTGTGQIQPGAGLTKTGNILDVVGTADRITANADSVDIASTYVGQTSITTLGTITTGTWTGDTIAVANGGTGGTTAADARSNLNAVGRYAVNNGGTTTDTVTHNLGSSDVFVSVRDLSSGQMMEADIFVVDANNIQVQYAVAPSAASLRIVVIG